MLIPYIKTVPVTHLRSCMLVIKTSENHSPSARSTTAYDDDSDTVHSSRSVNMVAAYAQRFTGHLQALLCLEALQISLSHTKPRA